jgi:hypothetical protein
MQCLVVDIGRVAKHIAEKNYSHECFNLKKTIKIVGMTGSLDFFHTAWFSAIFNRANYLSPHLLKPSFARAVSQYTPQVLRYAFRYASNPESTQ